MNTTQYATLYDSIADYIDSIIEANEPTRAIKLLELVVAPNLTTEALNQRLLDIIGEKNNVFWNIISLRKVYTCETNLNLDGQGLKVTKEELQKEFRKILEVPLQDLKEDMATQEKLSELSIQQSVMLKSYVNRKMKIREETMKAMINRTQSNLEIKVDKLEAKINHLETSVNEKLDQHFEFLKTVNQFMKDSTKDSEERKKDINNMQLSFSQVLDALHDIQSKLSKTEEKEAKKEQTKTPQFFQ